MMKRLFTVSICALCLLYTMTSCGGTVKIGLLAGLSGGNADLGEAGRNGAMIAVDRINAEGGIKGRQPRL